MKRILAITIALMMLTTTTVFAKSPGKVVASFGERAKITFYATKEHPIKINGVKHKKKIKIDAFKGQIFEIKRGKETILIRVD